MMEKNSNFSSLAKEAKSGDYYRYLTALFAPHDKQEHLFVAINFYNEIARIRDIVTEPMAGFVRLAWWREAISGIYQGDNKYKQLEGLREIIKTYDIPEELFINMINAREDELDNLHLVEENEMIDYLKNTSVGILKIFAYILDQKSFENESLICNIGIAYGITGIIRSMVFESAHNRCYISEDILNKYGVLPDDIAKGENLTSILNLTKDLYDKAKRYLDEIKNLHNGEKIPDAIILQISVIKYLLKNIRKNKYNPINLEQKSSKLIFKLILIKNLFRLFPKPIHFF